MNTKLYGALLLVTIVLAIGGVLTLIPASGASYPNLLGYKSLCTFAPAATLYCFAAAGITCVLRASLVKRAAYNNRKPIFRVVPIVVPLIVLCLALWSTILFVNAKSSYTDGTSAATSQNL